jgi:hypothetical protein
MELQYITDLAHRQSLGWHLVPPFDKEAEAHLRLRTVSECRGLRHRARLITTTGFGDHLRPESVITFHRIE